MSGHKRISIVLEPAECARLEAEAARLGRAPGTIALDYVGDGLGRTGETEAEQRRRAGLEALDWLAALRADIR